MLRISKLADYGTVVMTYLAYAPERLVSAPEVASAIGLELPTVSKILKILARAGLLRSQRGSKGGYVLARAPEDISVAEIIDALEGHPMGLTECSSTPGVCRRESCCSVRANWQRISETVRAVLYRISLTELSHPLSQAIDGAAGRREREVGMEQ